MRAFQAGELSRMQATQEAAMMDTCVHLRRFTQEDDYGNPVETFAEGESFACGIDLPPKNAEAQVNGQVVMVDARLRLPLDAETAIGNAERIRLTHRFGMALASDQDYEVIGEARRGPSGLVYNLRKVMG